MTLQMISSHLGRQTDDLAPTLHSQVRTDDTTNTCAQHFPFIIQQHSRIVVEPNHSTVWSPHTFPGANDDGTTDITSTNFDGSHGCLSSCRNGASTLDHADYLVPHGSPAVIDFLFQNVDAFNDQGARVVYALGLCKGWVTD